MFVFIIRQVQWKSIEAGALKALEAGLLMGGEAALHCLKAMLSAPTDSSFLVAIAG